jgi:hypothetical protein
MQRHPSHSNQIISEWRNLSASGKLSINRQNDLMDIINYLPKKRRTADLRFQYTLVDGDGGARVLVCVVSNERP